MPLPLQPLRNNAQRARVAREKSIPAPVGGWNARDPLADMDERDAVILDNWWPEPSDVRVRLGSDDHVTGITGTVESLMSYASVSANTLFGAAGTAIYNVNSAGAVGAAVVSGMTNARWQHANYRTDAGVSYLICVNGADKPQYWNGSAWIAVDGASTPAITGPTTTNLIGVNVFKSFVWFVEKSTMKAWYLPTGAVGGAATAVNLGNLFPRGGYLMAMGTWTIDAGAGADDFAVFVTSEGEVAVYQGTDPSAAATWALKGVYYVGRPIGRRCFVKLGGDLALLTENGLIPLSKALISGGTTTAGALTDKIQDAVRDAVRVYGSVYGWQPIVHPSASMLLLNVPLSSSMSHQYAMNAITGAWARFKGWNAACWEVHNGELYYGTSTKVVKAWTTDYNDNGANIETEVKQAFSYLGARGRDKILHMARPVFSSTGSPSVLIGADVDFGDVQPTGSLSFAPTTQSTWNGTTWGGGTWSGGYTTLRQWQSVPAFGTAIALRMRSATRSIDTRWVSTDYRFEVGD